MRVLRQAIELIEPIPASIVTIGNFDGVHRAHQELFRRVIRAARSAGVPALALTFDPHPARVLSPDRVPQTLTPLDLKIELMSGLGLDLVWILPFTRQIAQLTPEEFVEQVLLRALGARQVHVGANFCFGRNRQGTVELLTEMGKAKDFSVQIMPLMTLRGEPVSSSRVRVLLEEGKIPLANRLLGRPYEITGSVARGEGVGHRLTVPTLNLAGCAQQLPQPGVYITRTLFAERDFESLTNVGYKPTFGSHPLTVETHLLNDSGEVTGEGLRIQFLYRLRDEVGFSSPLALKAQIAKDIQRAVRYFGLCRRWLPSEPPPAVASTAGH